MVVWRNYDDGSTIITDRAELTRFFPASFKENAAFCKAVQPFKNGLSLQPFVETVFMCVALAKTTT